MTATTTSTRAVRVLHDEELDSTGRHLSWVRGYKPGDRMVEVFATNFEVPGNLPDLTVLGMLYDAFNYHPAPDLAGLTCKYELARTRSLSVGDLLILDVTAYAVAKYGWQKVDSPLPAVGGVKASS